MRLSAHGLAPGYRLLIGPIFAYVPLIRLGGKVDSGDGDEGHHHHIERDRRVAVGAQQGHRDDRREAARDGRGELVAQGGSRVAHPGREELGEERARGAVHRAQGDDGDAHCEPDQGRDPRVDHPEEREGEEEQEYGAAQVHGSAPDPVGERGEGPYGEDLDGASDQDTGEHGAAIHADVLGAVGEHKGDGDVETTVEQEERPHREQEASPVVAENVHNGELGAAPGLLHLLKGRGLEDLEPDEEPHRDEDYADEKRYAPAPGEKLLRRQRREDREDRRRHHQSGRDAHAGPAAEEAAPAGGSVLDGHQRGPAPLAPHGKALQKAQDAEEGRGHPHDDQGHHQHGFTPDLVPVVAAEHATYGTGYETDRVGSEGVQRAYKRVGPRKEELAEDQGRRGPVDEKVVPLDDGADEARRYHLLERGSVPYPFSA